jgi:phosphatidylserine/phosphatidylglycerophosphate/cardiolipin synthase-like enzyme
LELHIQPDDGIAPLLKAIEKAKKSIQILIFRFDRAEAERALVEAARRGVAVTALIAFTNRGEERNLRKLESRLLAGGVTVARTSDDLARYHGKMMIVDGKYLHLQAFNLTHLDINLSRSFAVVVKKSKVVEEAIKLFDCDVKRQPYTAGSRELVVSPVNSRKELLAFFKKAKKQLLLYEMKISDPEFLKLLESKRAEGVEVRIIGRVSRKNRTLDVRPLTKMRLHARCFLRDGQEGFLGSQSLRPLELEARREIGVIFSHAAIVKRIAKVFEDDWSASPPVSQDLVTTTLDLPAKKVAKAVVKSVKVGPMVEEMLERVVDPKSDGPFEPAEVAETVRVAFKDAVKSAVVEAVKDMASEDQNGGEPSRATKRQTAKKTKK